MTIPRFVLARSAGDSVTLRDTQKKRLAAIFPRDASLPEAQAEAAAVAMAETCAAALNQRCKPAQAKQQQEGGK